ncbi:hypothetical protein BEWA_032810 [Theileria equi strain WA]|uniref:Methyltransferase domain-containing protein n=1 Tax=Theileria equi strain WA TaxID=1537102 RepID=L0AYX4_THEEQ|nr:hypothetical protein BEWA_032810 [Theileria equi strain WA]AFZ80428.1 hypothetical protein BEWA_032810 [Theileria equi strain WA]|eukprot:XP_004830094.1 hypothetical protein BEWA_032810 [Theileria equi strain WA]
MDVLPTDVSSFRSPQYWNQFYSNPKLVNFEWYGDFKRILFAFQKCLEEQKVFATETGTLGGANDHKNALIVNVGCGNSNTSNVLIDEGYQVVYNLDFSEQVLQDMRKTCKGNTHMIKVDVSSSEYAEFGRMINDKHKGQRKIIIDKAFLDAFISIGEGEGEETIKQRAKSYIENTLEMMSFGDVFVIISLAQDYVVKEIIRNVLFKDVFVDIYPLDLDDGKKDNRIKKSRAKAAHLMQFLFAIYKVDKSKHINRKQCKMGSIGTFGVEYFEVGQIAKMIKRTRTTFYLGPTIRDYTPGRRLTFDIYPKDKDSSCFTAAVYDVVDVADVKLSTCAIIVPTGQEQLWMFSTTEGNEELAKNAKSKRIIIVWLKYDTLDIAGGEHIENPLESPQTEAMNYIQNNLGEVLNKLSLESSGGVTIMKIGETSAVKSWKCVVPSKYAGNIIVRDIFDDSMQDCYKRQMIFSSSPQVIQSEVMYREESGVEKFLFNYPSNEYHVAVALSMAFLPSQSGSVAILGSGTGVLTSILLLFLNNRMHLVELDDAVINIGREYFGLDVSSTIYIKQFSSDTTFAHEQILHIHGDALGYLERCGDCDAIILDINNGDEGVEDVNDDALVGKIGETETTPQGKPLTQGTRDVFLEKGILMSPNPRFLEKDALDNVDRILSSSNGLFIVNLLTRSNTAKKRVLEMLDERFKWIAVIKTPNDLNDVLVCSNSSVPSAQEMYIRHAHVLKDDYSLISDFGTWTNGFSILKSDGQGMVLADVEDFGKV